MSTNHAFRIESSFEYHKDQSCDPDLAELLNQVYDHLTGALDWDHVSMVSEGEESFAVSLVGSPLPSETSEQTLLRAMSALRTAIHAVGCGTPDWPTENLHRPAESVVLKEQTFTPMEDLVDA